MYRALLIFTILICSSSLCHAQFRAAQSSAGGYLSSASYSTRATVGEAVGGTALNSNQERLVTGFYLMFESGIDTQGPRILFVEIGDETLAPQAITPPSPLIQPANLTIPIVTQISDGGSGVSEATLYYRQGGTASFIEQNMSTVSGMYSGEIESTLVNANGIEYYIIARDSLDNTSRNPLDGIHGIQVQIDAPGLQLAFPGDSTLTGYRLIATPLQLTNPNSNNVLNGLGTYNDDNWRFWRLRENYTEFSGTEQYQELRGGTAFSPGDAFWLISRNDWTIQTGQAVSITTQEPFTKTLHPGWNFVSSPFNFPIPLQNISLSSAASLTIKVYEREWLDAQSMTPFTGYAVNAGESDNVILSINPDISPSSSKQAPEQSPEINSMLWGIQISATSDIAADRNNFLGVNPTASAGWDEFDMPEPPVIGDYLSVSFPHTEWGKIHKRYESDIRPIPSFGEEWQFDVITGTPQTVELKFDGIDDIPVLFSVHLIDEFNKTMIDLRDQNTYTVHSPGFAQTYPLTIHIGETEYIEEQVESNNLRPNTPSLDQNYPNPFNPTTSIRYGLIEPSLVTLEVYNSLGQVVKTLVHQVVKDAGYHTAIWNALSEDGAPASSGLYLYRLSISPQGSAQSSPTVLIRKMVLIK